MMTGIKRTLALIVVAAMISVSFAAVLTTQNADAASAKSIKKMAKKSKNGLKKYKGSWYYIKKHKVVKGLKKVKGKYYYFDKKGAMKHGSKKIKGKNYYFNKIKSGKKKGQAPALAKEALAKGGKAYFYKANAQRYELQYKSTGNIKGDTAVGAVLSGANVKSVSGNEARLKKAYVFIVNKYSYNSRPTPNLKTNAWTYKCAYDMAMGMNMMGKEAAGNYTGKCYNFAALTGLTAKALGYNTVIIPGTCKRPGANAYTEHAWAIINEGGKHFLLDSMWDHNGKKNGTTNFFKKQVPSTEKFEFGGCAYKK